MSTCIIPMRHQSRFILLYMGKLRFTLTNIIFWVVLLLSCLLSENFAVLNNDPLKGFMDDILVIPVNMAGLPGMNIPMGFSKDNLPVGLHIIGDSFEEAKMYQLASFLEKKLKLNLDPRGDKHE